MGGRLAAMAILLAIWGASTSWTLLRHGKNDEGSLTALETAMLFGFMCIEQEWGPNGNGSPCLREKVEMIDTRWPMAAFIHVLYMDNHRAAVVDRTWKMMHVIGLL